MQEKLFVIDEDGLMHEVKTKNGAVSQDDLNEAIKKYHQGTGIPVNCLKIFKVKEVK